MWTFRVEWANPAEKQACKNSSTVPNGQLTGSSWQSPHPESQLQGVQFPHWGSDQGKVYRRSLGQVYTIASSPSGAGWVRDKQRGQRNIWRVANRSTSWPKLSISASPLRVKPPFLGPQPLPRQDVSCKETHLEPTTHRCCPGGALASGGL